jgi:hypothetical protein
MATPAVLPWIIVNTMKVAGISSRVKITRLSRGRESLDHPNDKLSLVVELKLQRQAVHILD